MINSSAGKKFTTVNIFICAMRNHTAIMIMPPQAAKSPMVMSFINGMINCAEKKSGVKRIVYTSLLHADTSPLNLAPEHAETEKTLKASGIDYTILRNGWYTENYTDSIAPALANGAFYGSAGEGKIASAAREDFAESAVVVLTEQGHSGKTYELAGDEPYTLAQLAAEVTKQSGKQIPYNDIP